MKKRIWELDALRGLCIIGVVLVHLVYDLVEMFGILNWHYPDWFAFIKDWGGVIFLILSGVCVTLGSHHIRRGIIVLCGGALCTMATYAMTKFGFDSSVIIYFGVLDCLGSCMILWSMYRALPWWALVFHGAVLIWTGFLLPNLVAPEPWMVILGFNLPGFCSSDYFPLLPYLGFFILGAALGRVLYKNKQSLIPCFDSKTPVLRQLCFCGRHSLWIYLLHQPVLAGICYLLTL